MEAEELKQMAAFEAVKHVKSNRKSIFLPG